jgi:hypothetical protein
MDYADISEETLILRLKSTEHDFVERKAKNDKGGWLRTAVGFANSVQIGWPAILFVGAEDDGTPQLGPEELKDHMKAVSAILDRAYPPIDRSIIPIHLGEKACLAVVIPGSPERPHFSGKSYCRVGTETKEASQTQFSKLVAQRNSKARFILEWKGKQVTLEIIKGRGTVRYWPSYTTGTITDCNQFFVTLQLTGSFRSIPLARIELSFDHERNQLKISTEE